MKNVCRNIVATAAIALTVITGTTFTTESTASANPVDSTQAKSRLFELVNSDRIAGGLSPLTLRGDLDDIATAHSQRMAEAGDIFHNDEFFTAASKSRIGAKSVGENVAHNGSIDDAHRRLMASPGHRANLMSSTFSVLGIGLANVNGTWYITEVFIQPTSAAGVAAPVATPAPAPPVASAPAAPPAPAPTRQAASSPAAPRPAPAPRAARAAAPAPAPAAPAPAPAPVEVPVEAPVEAVEIPEPTSEIDFTGQSNLKPDVIASTGGSAPTSSNTPYPGVLIGLVAGLALTLGVAARTLNLKNKANPALVSSL